MIEKWNRLTKYLFFSIYLQPFSQLCIGIFPNFGNGKIVLKADGFEQMKEMGHIPLCRIGYVEFTINRRYVDNNDSVDNFGMSQRGVHDGSTAHRMSN